jgi:hypothetical protein
MSPLAYSRTLVAYIFALPIFSNQSNQTQIMALLAIALTFAARPHKKPAMIGLVLMSLIALKLPMVAAPRGREQVSGFVVTFQKTMSSIF